MPVPQLLDDHFERADCCLRKRWQGLALSIQADYSHLREHWQGMGMSTRPRVVVQAEQPLPPDGRRSPGPAAGRGLPRQPSPCCCPRCPPLGCVRLPAERHCRPRALCRQPPRLRPRARPPRQQRAVVASAAADCPCHLLLSLLLSLLPADPAGCRLPASPPPEGCCCCCQPHCCRHRHCCRCCCCKCCWPPARAPAAFS